VFLATAPVLVVALLQEGGGILLAAEVIGVVLLVHLVETFFLNPRIVGKLLDLHPVLVVSILPVAEFFFGIWGVLLSTPVAVYLITEIIYRESHPPAAGEKPPGKVAAAPSG
jgi:predicted PurR-regulated permease PerM